jgi:hypothetical protein
MASFVNRVCPVKGCGRPLQRFYRGKDAAGQPQYELKCIIASHHHREPLPIDVQLREMGQPMLPGMEEGKG